MKPSINRLRCVLSYDPSTGVLMRKYASGMRKAGTPKPRYISVMVDCKFYQAHRVAWAIYYGEWPDSDIDHINHNPHDNRIDNLRLCDDSQNQANRHCGPLRGITYHKRCKKWQAQIKVRGKNIYLGLFADKREAIASYRAAAIKYFGDYAEHARAA